MKRRSAGTIGGRLWALFDTLCAQAGAAEKLEIAVVKANPHAQLFNRNKVVIEFYQWRKFNGISGRASVTG